VCGLVGDSVASVNLTFFSSHDLRYRFRPRSALPSLRTSVYTATALRLLYKSKRDLQPSKGAFGIGTASQRLTAESAAPAASVCSMECFMTSHACLALPLPLSLLTHVTLLPNPTLIAQAGTI
jgi:hypothetical protein